MEGAIPSTSLLKDTPEAPKAEVDEEGNPLVAVTGERRVTNKVPSAKRQKEMEREEKEREYAKRQHSNMINGVWHCSNCGCPDDIAIGRRKGPLGDKSQCGECGMFSTFSNCISPNQYSGKYYHRYRKPREVVYNTDREHHLQLRDKNSKNPRVAAAARAAAASATPAPTPMEDTPVSTPTLPTISVTAPQPQEPPVAAKSPSSRGSSSEPLAQTATKVKDESVAPEAPPAPPVPEPAKTPAPPPTTTIAAPVSTDARAMSKEKPEVN
jgi:SWI/SNF-related matrix-associated actin-dependent regulator of chromatin subfamily B protein 1